MANQTITVTGGGGYVGARLVPKLLEAGHRVKVIDTFWYGEEVLPNPAETSELTLIKSDIRDRDAVRSAVEGADTVIHLACISNDPSFDMDPALGRSINLDAFEPLVNASIAAGVKRFIYASSSSVYGVKDLAEVTEDVPLEPLTDYSKFKAQCEDILLDKGDAITTIIIRPATVCGVSPRQRMDLIHNILTNHAVVNQKIRVFGGAQKRPGIHIEDMTDLYAFLLDVPHDKVHQGIFNAGAENQTVNDLAKMVQAEVGGDVEIEQVPTDDNRSYHVSSQRLSDRLGFTPTRSLRDGVRDVKEALRSGAFEDSLHNPRYFNIKRMQELTLA